MKFQRTAIWYFTSVLVDQQNSVYSVPLWFVSPKKNCFYSSLLPRISSLLADRLDVEEKSENFVNIENKKAKMINDCCFSIATLGL